MHSPISAFREALFSRRIPGLDFLRAFAVFLVLGDHFGLNESIRLPIFNGALGVEIFFVLSGFLITWMLLGEVEKSGGIRIKDFYQRRIARLMPVFYAYLLFGLIYSHIRNIPIPWGAVYSSIAYVVNYFQAFTGAPAHFLSHCWSLAVEEQFYFLWPFILLLGHRRGWKLQHTLLGLIIAVWLYRAFMWKIAGASDEYMYRGLETRADNLLGGCLLAVVVREEQTRKKFSRFILRNGWVGWLLAAVAAISGGFHGNLTYRYVFGYGIDTIATSLLIPFVIVHAQMNQGIMARAMNSRIIVSLGQASYGIYLFHQIFLHAVKSAIEQHVTRSVFVTFPISAAFVFFLAYLSYTHFETPIRERLRPKSH